MELTVALRNGEGRSSVKIHFRRMSGEYGETMEKDETVYEPLRNGHGRMEHCESQWRELLAITYYNTPPSLHTQRRHAASLASGRLCAASASSIIINLVLLLAKDSPKYIRRASFSPSRLKRVSTF